VRWCRCLRRSARAGARRRARAAAAEQWLGTSVNVMPPAQRLLQAARTLWNLRQFELARRNRGLRALRDTEPQAAAPRVAAAALGPGRDAARCR
jgi:general secretion pathway protein L